jgi:peptidoglycan/LPS O-acetylase OafA/YrhL
METDHERPGRPRPGVVVLCGLFALCGLLLAWGAGPVERPSVRFGAPLLAVAAGVLAGFVDAWRRAKWGARTYTRGSAFAITFAIVLLGLSVFRLAEDVWGEETALFAGCLVGVLGGSAAATRGLLEGREGANRVGSLTENPS